MGKWDGVLYLLQHHHRESDFCIKMGSNESHFSVSFSAMGRVTRQWPCLHHKLRMERRSKAGNQEGLRVLLIATDLTFFFLSFFPTETGDSGGLRAVAPLTLPGWPRPVVTLP